MKPILAAVAALSISQLSAQELVTAEQLLRNARAPDMTMSVLMYVAGWRDGTSTQLLNTATALREAGEEADQIADYQESLGQCLGRLQAVDLITHLELARSTSGISRNEPSATTALLDATVELCQSAVAEALAED